VSSLQLWLTLAVPRSNATLRAFVSGLHSIVASVPEEIDVATAGNAMSLVGRVVRLCEGLTRAEQQRLGLLEPKSKSLSGSGFGFEGDAASPVSLLLSALDGAARRRYSSNSSWKAVAVATSLASLIRSVTVTNSSYTVRSPSFVILSLQMPLGSTSVALQVPSSGSFKLLVLEHGSSVRIALSAAAVGAKVVGLACYRCNRL